MRTLCWIFAFAMPMMALMLTVVPMMEQPVVAGQPTAVEIKIDNFSFTPPTITVKAGTEVTWTNKDDIPHNVVSEDKSFKSKVLDTDEKFTYTASKPGTYTYYCSIHPKMTGKLVVE
jgi:plastocyanin